MMLAPIWEFWNWTSGEWTFLGVALLLYTAYAFGFAQGRYPDDEGERIWQQPGWIQAALVTGVAGILMVIIANGTDCLPGECYREP